jgi:hypothetical protein
MSSGRIDRDLERDLDLQLRSIVVARKFRGRRRDGVYSMQVHGAAIAISFLILPVRGRFEVALHFSVTELQIGVMLSDIGFSNSVACTMAAEYGNMVHGQRYLWYVATVHDIAPCITEIASLIDDFVIPWLHENHTRIAIRALLELGSAAGGTLNPSNSAQCMTLVAIAVLDDPASALPARVASCRSWLAKIPDRSLERFNMYVGFLTVKATPNAV